MPNSNRSYTQYFEDAMAHVDSLKGHALTVELKTRKIPVGSDPVASKRQRLMSYYVRKFHNKEWS